MTTLSSITEVLTILIKYKPYCFFTDKTDIKHNGDNSIDIMS